MNDTMIEIVRETLDRYPDAWNSDEILYQRIIDKFAADGGYDVRQINLPMLMNGIRRGIFPAFETVRRTRQKIQQHHPELGATEKTRRARAKKEADVRSFMRSEI